MLIIVFEDDQVYDLHPVTLGRPAYAISCGSYRLIDWICMLGQPVRGIVRPQMKEIQRIEYAELDSDSPSPETCLLINARLVPSRTAFEQLQKLANGSQACIVWNEDTVAAAVLNADLDIQPPRNTNDLHEVMQKLRSLHVPSADCTLPLMEYPHDIIRYNMQILSENIEHRIAHGDLQEIADGVFAAAGAKLGEYNTTDTSEGPILLEQGASIGPFCLLRGPVYLGHGARVNEHAAIKDGVSIGHTTKTGGEVEASVIEPYTNKQHHGFLGHSYIGSWVNLGAGTCNSDLKNTYGRVNVEYRGQKVATGMQFVGCIMGDYSKTAINTGIFTGKIIGACSMLYGFVTTNVPSFVNYARLFGQVSELPPEVMISTQERMFRRRNVTQRPCDVQLIRDMYELTRHERQLAGEPLTL